MPTGTNAASSEASPKCDAASNLLRTKRGGQLFTVQALVGGDDEDINEVAEPPGRSVAVGFVHHGNFVLVGGMVDERM